MSKQKHTSKKLQFSPLVDMVFGSYERIYTQMSSNFTIYFAILDFSKLWALYYIHINNIGLGWIWEF